jgi:uncharacterized protein YjgD (DUF1641 family)
LPTVAAELEDVAPHVRPDDIAVLLKQILRNMNNLNAALTHLQGAGELVQEATPIARQLLNDAITRLDEMDRKGYFAMGRELTRALDNVVSEFTVEDVRLLADNLTVILHTVKNLTQPDMLQAINNAVEIYKKVDFNSIEEFSLWRSFREINKPENSIEEFSLWRSFREINKPEMRRGLGFLIVFLRNLSAHPPGAPVRPAPDALPG